MVFPHNAVIIFIIVTAFSWSTSAYCRQNIIIGEISTGYNFAERKFDDNDNKVEARGTVPAAQNTGTNTLERENSGATALSPNDTDQGDTRRWFIAPRIRTSSRGINDFLEFTYAPSLHYEELESDTNWDHDLNLSAEKYFAKDWSFFASDNFYYGDDVIADAELSSSVIIPGAEETEGEQTIGAEQTDKTGLSLREQNERRKYWRNTFNIGTDYTYAQDSVVGLGYTFGVLRNINDVDGFQVYDRHEGTGRLSYRINRSLQTETQVGYVKGIYEPTEITFIQPEIVQVPIENESSVPDEEEKEIEFEEQTVFNQSQEESNDDLEEYQFLFRLNYDWQTHDRLFGLYSYDGTDYESALREDAAIHKITLGWSHDISRALSMTLSGGPSFSTYDKRSTETGYNAHVGVNWNFHQYASLTANSSYGYDFNNFDGNRTGLSQTWRSELGYSYQFTPLLTLSLSTSYERGDREEPIQTTILLDLEGEEVAGDDVNEFTDEQYDAGLTLSYNFLRWYTMSASYRYADYQSENDQDYDEHRVSLTLATSKDLFRW